MSVVRSFIPVIQAAAYADGQALGTSAKELTDVFKDTGRVSYLKNVIVRDKAKQNAALTLYFFSQAPATSTITDKVDVDISDADLQFFIGRAIVTDTDYENFANNSVAQVEVTVQMQGGGYKSVWVVPVCRDTPTWVSTSDLTISASFIQE